jgi:murein DD-endopeptidase MepM/ murein hydrolase activator NlpD
MGFRPDGASRNRWVVLVGVSSQAQKGEYALRVTAQAGTRSAVFLTAVTVIERVFHFERIPLSTDLTTLRTEKDPRKNAEAKEMARVLATPHPDAIYEEGTILVPLAGARRTSGYGDRRKYVYTDNSADYSVHEGLDIASPTGTPVPACGRGRVVLAGSRIMTGNTVIIEHLPGLFSIYFHLSEIAVKLGDMVAEGDIIGKVGMTGLATGPHLHWEIQALGVPIDPDALAAGPILDRNADFGDIGASKDPKGGE